MLLSFKTLVLSAAGVLIILNFYFFINNKKVPAYVLVLTSLWFITMLFFWKALLHDFCLVPGDILCFRYPWKSAFPLHTRPHNPLLFDSVANYYPWMSTIKAAMNQGCFPLWNFHSYSGSPFIANFASAVFYPLNLFLFFMSVADFSTFMPFLRLVIAGTGTFLFLRILKFSPLPSFMGGIIFAYCGVNIVWLSNCPNISVIICMPWLMMCMERIASGRSFWWFFFLFFWSVFQFLGGHPESSFHVYLIVVPWFLYQLHVQWSRGTEPLVLLKRFLIVACAGVLSLGAVSFQLFPFLEYLPHTSRYFEIAEKGVHIVGDFKFIDLLKLVMGTMINPDFFGNPVDNNYWGFANYNEQNTYFTVAGLFFSVLGIIKAPSRKFGKCFFAGAALLSFCMIVRLPFFYGAVKQLPVFDMATNYRLIFAVVFCMTILAVSGLEEFLVCGTVKKHHLICVFSLLVIGAFLIHYFTLDGVKSALMGYRLKKMMFFLLMLTIIFIFSMISFKFNAKSLSLCLLLAFLVLIDCLHHGVNYNTFMDKKHVFPETPLISFIKSQPGKFRVVGWNGSLMIGAEQVHGYDSITGYDPMKIYSYERILSLVNGSYNPIGTCEIQSLKSKWLNFLNVRYIAVPPYYTDTFLNTGRFKIVYDGRDGRVYENKDAMPRVFLAEHLIFTNTHEKAYKIVSDNNFSPDHGSVVEHDSYVMDIEELQVQLGIITLLEPEIVKYNDSEIMLNIPEPVKENGGKPSIIVVSEVWFPGWQAFVDGKVRRVLRINSAFMGIRIFPGEQNIKLVFKPDSFKIGALISMGSFFIIFIAAFFLTGMVLNRHNRKVKIFENN